jgi:hypothetical protein
MQGLYTSVPDHKPSDREASHGERPDGEGADRHRTDRHRTRGSGDCRHASRTRLFQHCRMFHYHQLPSAISHSGHNIKVAMSPQPIRAESREFLGNLRNLLLEQHKLLLDRERAAYEKTYGPIAGPGPFLTLVLGDPHFAWLKQISTLVVEIDEALSRRSKAGQPEADAIIAQAREIMRPREHGTDFQARYYNAVKESPDVEILQCRLEQLLTPL